MKNIPVFLNEVHFTTYNLIRYKFPCVPSLLHVCAITYCLVQRPQLSQSHTNTHTCFTYYHTIKHTKIFLRQPISCAINYCTKINFPNVTVYTPTQTYASHIIVHFNIRQHFHTITSQIKTKFHQVYSLYPTGLIMVKSIQIHIFNYYGCVNVIHALLPPN